MKQIPVCNPPFNYADTTVSPQLVTNLISSCSTSSSPLTKINVNLYQLILATCVRTVVEAGSSFGVSTIYLALAVDQNSPGGKVIATEKEVSKVRRAREHWREAGKEVEKAMDLREGDLLQTLKEGLWEVDLLLLDIWTPLALPTLKTIQSCLGPGAVIVADNTISAAEWYKKFLAYVRDPAGSF